jgi:hypothetical protein
MNNTTYHTDTSRISKSGLDKIAITPAHYYHYYIAGNRDRPTKDMQLGTALHELILEPAEYWSNPANEPFREVSKAMRDALKQHPVAKKYLFGDGRPEVAAFFDYNDAPVKIKTDWLPNDSELIVDLKTTRDASPSGFRRSVRSYRYHVQDALYSAAWADRVQVLFIAIEERAPHRVECYVLDDELRDEGRRLLDRDILTYNACRKSGVWPNYSTHLIQSL